MKQRYLITYDYGQGALWAFLLAESTEDIRTRHPEVRIVDQQPDWMTDEELPEVETIDIDQADGTWLGIPPGREASN